MSNGAILNHIITNFIVQATTDTKAWSTNVWIYTTSCLTTEIWVIILWAFINKNTVCISQLYIFEPVITLVNDRKQYMSWTNLGFMQATNAQNSNSIDYSRKSQTTFYFNACIRLIWVFLVWKKQNQRQGFFWQCLLHIHKYARTRIL